MARYIQVKVTGSGRDEELVTYPIDPIPDDVTFYESKDKIVYAQFWKAQELVMVPAWKIVSIS